MQRSSCRATLNVKMNMLKNTFVASMCCIKDSAPEVEILISMTLAAQSSNAAAFQLQITFFAGRGYLGSRKSG